MFILFRCYRSGELMNKRTICLIHKCTILLSKKGGRGQGEEKKEKKKHHFFKNGVKRIRKPVFKK